MPYDNKPQLNVGKNFAHFSRIFELFGFRSLTSHKINHILVDDFGIKSFIIILINFKFFAATVKLLIFNNFSYKRTQK